ncbi:helix-turn-helix domain-containing protein [Streptomyces sp. NPDC052023]|uniref:helix-turn-helix domain-containing protein n=1 Tax=Streptomyces sp. NPDC052023 TaxID=3365681 RepID=UPI0037D716B3
MAGWITELRAAQDPGTAVSEALSRPETIAEAERVLGRDAIRWAVQTASAISDSLADAARHDPGLHLTRLERQACEASLLALLQTWQTGQGGQKNIMPPEALEHVRLAVRQGASLGTVLRAPWRGQVALQDALMSVVSQAVPPDRLVDEVRLLTRQVQALGDQYVRELTACYEAEHAAWQEGVVAARRQVMDEIVDTGRAPADAEQILGVRLTGHHLAGVLWNISPVRSDDGSSQWPGYARRAAAAAGAESALAVPQQDGSALVVWSFSEAPDAGTADVLRAVGRPSSQALALGPVGVGVSGLRDSVHGARHVSLVGQRKGTAGAWSYDDVALLALLSADFAAAGRFVRAVLPGLTGRDARSEGIRETLRAYLQHGRSRIAAGQELNLAATTVAYRVRQAEEILGRPAVERADETVAALLLADSFPELLGEAD